MSTGWRTLRRGDERDFTILRIREDVMADPQGREHPRVIISAPDWVHVLAITAGGQAVLVRQFRAGIHADTLEFPGGMVDPGETPDAAAARELEEETGFVAARWRALGACHPNPALQVNRLHTFLALDCQRRTDPRPDPGEDVRVELVPAVSLRQRVATGEITHALVLASMCQAAVRGLLP
ncbi:MAG TPA: NUDIX hydrolase [Myxococcaceae bacterium]|nr:NUDIX hydrolase [Myxococcaceae bacterium]